MGKMRFVSCVSHRKASMSEPDISNVNESIRTVAERARKAAWDFEWVERADDEKLLRISVPNGRNSRAVAVGEIRADRLLGFDFEEFRLLGDYSAINHPASGYIEALIQDTGDFRAAAIRHLPGAQRIDDDESTSEFFGKALFEESNQSVDARRPREYWRLRVRDERHSWYVEISPMTDKFLGLVLGRFITSRRRYTLKLFGIDAPQHDDAVRKLEGIGGAFLFDLDLRYGATYELALHRSPSSAHEYEARPIEQSPSLPRLQYPAQALSLYNYARSASEMPLLQFLAYYQVLEYFFPMYSQREMLRRLRQMITSPRFEVSDDADLAKILQLVTANSRSGYGNEKDQLKATLSGCVEISSLLDLLRSDVEFFRSLTDKKTIRDVPVIDENNRGIPLIDQVVARVYALRNRVVHAKADGGEMAVELLLPGSVEARSMTADIAIVQFLAQKAIVAGGTQI
jgi:hypothetical protein